MTEHKRAITLQHREGGETHGGCTLVDLSMLVQVCKPHIEILKSHPPAPGDYRVFFLVARQGAGATSMPMKTYPPSSPCQILSLVGGRVESVGVVLSLCWQTFF